MPWLYIRVFLLWNCWAVFWRSLIIIVILEIDQLNAQILVLY